LDIRLENVPLAEALRQVENEAAKQGSILKIWNLASPYYAPQKIRLSLQSMPVPEMLGYIGALSGTEITTTPDGFAVYPPSLLSETKAQAMADILRKCDALRIGKLDAEALPLENFARLLAKQTLANTGDEIPIVLDSTHLDPKQSVTLHLSNPTLNEVLAQLEKKLWH